MGNTKAAEDVVLPQKFINTDFNFTYKFLIKHYLCGTEN